MAEQMFPPLVSKTGLGGGSLSNSSAMFLQPELLEFAPELPDVFDLMSIGVSKIDIADMICRTSLDDIERLPAIHPSVMSSRGEQVTRYISFVSSPPIETRAPKDRPRFEKKNNSLGPEDCFRCQLKTDHAACERHKFVRVGGGFRHSFSYIKQVLDVIEDKTRQQAAAEAKRLARVREEQKHKAFLRATQQKRKVKTYVRTKSGKLIKQYVFVTEQEYQEMKDDDVAARRILGLSADEKLEDFTSSRKKYVVNEDGEYVEVHKIRDDSAYQESLKSVKRGQHAGKGKHRHRRRRGKGGNYSDDDLSIESGVGGSIDGGTGRSRRRRRRHRRGGSSYSSSVSEESYISTGGTKHVKYRRRRRHRSRDGEKGRRRRNRSYSSSGDSDDCDGNGKNHSRRRRKHGHRRRRSYYSSDDSDEDGSRSGHRKRRHRRRKGSSYSEDSDDEKRHRRRRRRRRRRRSGSQRSGDYSDVSEGSHHRRRRRRHRRHSGDSESFSDYSGSSYDSTTDSRRRRRHRKHRDNDHPQDGNGISGSGTDCEDDGRKRHHRRRHRQHRDRDSESYSSEYSTPSNEEEGEGGRKHRRHRRSRDDSSDGSDHSNCVSRSKKKRKGNRGRRKDSEDESESYSTEGDEKHDDSKKRRRHRRRRKHNGGEEYDSSSSSYSETSVDSKGSGENDSDSPYMSSSDISTDSTSSSSAVSSASSVSSVDSSDISSIEGDYSEGELQRLKKEKKEKKKMEKQQTKQQVKEIKRKEAREEKRESKRKERAEKVKEKKKRKEEKKRERRRNKRKMSPVSSVSDVSSVNSDDISDVGSNLGEDERRALIEEKKMKKKEAKKDKKFEEKVEKKKEEWKAKKKEKEKRRKVIELQKELERMSSASSVESVNSDEISSVDSDLSDGEKQRVKEKKKKKLKAERQLTKNIVKAKIQLKEKRKKEGKASDSEDDVNFDEIGYEEIKKAINKSKGGKKKNGANGGIEDDGSDNSSDNYGYGSKTNKASKNKKKKEKRLPKDDMLELRAPDGTKIRVSIPKNMRVGGKFVGKIRLKGDGTVAADDDEDAESVIIDEDGNLVSQPTMLINPKTIVLDNETWEGFQPTPPPPKTPTDGGRVQFTGIKKVLHAFRKNGEVLQKHLDEVLYTAGELNDYKQRGDKMAMLIDERDSSIDYISHFRLVEKRKLDPFGKAFVVEDDDFNCVINLNELKGAIEGIPTLQTLKPKQLEYALKVLNIDEHSMITFKMFAVMAALSERMCTMDSFSQHLIDISDLMDIERKMELYKAMFYCNVNSERSDNHITAESLHIELRAGGLNRAQEEYIMSLMKPDEYSDISFIDYMAYIPLFLSMHENIIDNPLDMEEKYNMKTNNVQQRDMNPLGLPLRREFIDAAKPGTERKVSSTRLRSFIEKGDLLSRGATSSTSLPRIPSARKGSSK
ncbi:trichohyalin-like isoform X1 [Anneissia japonica]|uniref:trichohyalin-like isoform X1 n=1 Tax=Anneissia japonica TaxID=1529436 RepID=UPI0014258C0B|nr:trichohyalin-like isoform X1 [Anneissia japonica]